MTAWVFKFSHGDHVQLRPNDMVEARVTDIHLLGQNSSVEYDVRFFHNGEAKTVRVFEDELVSTEHMVECFYCNKRVDPAGCALMHCPITKKDKP